MCQVFLGTHYIGERNNELKIEDGEYWKKVLGPVFVYLNSRPNGGNLQALWEDVKAQAQAEESKWPYSFIESEDFPKAAKRGSIQGRLFVRDRYVTVVSHQKINSEVRKNCRSNTEK